MKKIILKQIEIRDWRSINKVVNFGENTTEIDGKNGCGKSSIFHAWVWLFTSRTDIDNGKNIDLFDNRYPITHRTPEASVKATISIDGSEYEIKRTAQPCFVRDRETREYVKQSSDKYKTYIDGLEVSATDFDKWVDIHLCDKNMLLFCLDGSFFTSLASEDRRKARGVLDSIVGEIVDEDFESDFSELLTSAGKTPIDTYYKQVKSKIKEYDKEIESLESKVEVLELEASNGAIEYPKVKDEIESLEKRRSELNDIISNNSEQTKRLYERKSAYDAEFLTKKEVMKEDIRSSERDIDGLNANKNNLESAIAQDTSALGVWRLKKHECESKLERNQNEKTCPTCGREYPDDFMSMRADEILAIKKDITECDEELEKIKNRMEANRKMLSSLCDVIKATERIVYAKNEDLKRFELEHKAFEETEEYITEYKLVDTSNVSSEIAAIDVELKRLYEKAGSINPDSKEETIKKLNGEIRDYSNKRAQQSKYLYLCDLMFNERADIVSTRINSLLREYKISMWSQLKNGEMVPDCLIMDANGVTYATLNTAHRIKAAIEIKEMFCKHFGLELPTFVDEASVFDDDNLPTMDYQTIYLKASNNEEMIIKYE